MSDQLAQIKQGAKWLWAQGDYARLATLLETAATSLATRCVRPGVKVLDVAAGNGNLALAAARLGARVTASDLTPRMLELGSARTAAAGLDVEWCQGDAESLPFEAASFDVVASVFGAVFAPQPDLVAAEMFRVVRPGGIVAMANYGAAGYFGGLAELIGRFSTRPGVELPSPFLWGDEKVVRERLGPLAATIHIERKLLRLEFTSYEDWHRAFALTNPPLTALKMLLPPAAYEGLIADAWRLAEELNVAAADSVAVESSYLEVVSTSPRG